MADMNYTSFETDRLLLRPTIEEDADFLLELMNTPKWHKYIGDRNVYSREQALTYIREKMQPQLERLGFSNYTVIRKHDQQKVGTCGLYDREGLEGIDIGFSLLPAYEKQGYAFEAANRLKEAAITDLGLTNINAITTKTNLASQNLLTKLGLRQTGTRTVPGDEEELLFFELR